MIQLNSIFYNTNFFTATPFEVVKVRLQAQLKTTSK